MSVGLRPAAASDERALQEIGTAAVDARAPGLPTALVDQQHRAQESAWSVDHPTMERCVVEVGGRVVGRCYVALEEDRVDLVDLTVLEEHRARGIGAAVLRLVLERADRRPVHLHVRADSAAVRLYRRVGFVEVARDQVHLVMVHAPG